MCLSELIIVLVSRVHLVINPFTFHSFVVATVQLQKYIHVVIDMIHLQDPTLVLIVTLEDPPDNLFHYCHHHRPSAYHEKIGLK